MKGLEKKWAHNHAHLKAPQVTKIDKMRHGWLGIGRFICFPFKKVIVQPSSYGFLLEKGKKIKKVKKNSLKISKFVSSQINNHQQA